MIDMKLYGKCERCRKNGWFIRRREVMIPIGLKAKSKDKLCNECHKSVISVVTKNV